MNHALILPLLVPLFAVAMLARRIIPRDTAYVDEERVREETIRARRMFEKHGWPVIDVTRRSIEESAAAIIALVNQRRMAGEKPELGPV